MSQELWDGGDRLNSPGVHARRWACWGLEGDSKDAAGCLSWAVAAAACLTGPPGLDLHTPVGPELAEQTCPKSLMWGLMR